MILDTLAVVGYVALLTAALVYVRQSRGMRDFAVAGQRLPATITFATLAATCIGPGFAVGLAGKVAGGGFIWVLVFAFFSVQMLVTGVWLAPKLRAIEGALTLGDVLRTRFGRGAQLATGVVSVLFCAGVIGAIAKVTGAFAGAVLGADPTTAIIVGMVVVVGYSSLGGIKAVVLTDVIQFVILAVFVPMVVLFEVPKAGPAAADALFSFNTGQLTVGAFLGLAASFGLGEFLIPPYAQRALMAEGPPAAGRAFVWLALFSLVWFAVVGIIGTLGAMAFPDAAADDVFILVVTQALPAGLKGLVLAALLAVVASTQDSLLNSASVALTQDLALPFRDIDDRQQVLLAKVTCVVVGVGATAFALYVPSLIDGLLLAYAIWAPTMVAPIIAALVWPSVGRWAGLAGMAAGAATTVVWTWVLSEPGSIPAVLPGVAVSAVATYIAGRLSTKLPVATPNATEQMVSNGGAR